MVSCKILINLFAASIASALGSGIDGKTLTSTIVPDFINCKCSDCAIGLSLLENKPLRVIMRLKIPGLTTSIWSSLPGV